MKTSIQVLSEALKGSLTAQVKIKAVGPEILLIRVLNRTDSGTPVHKDYKLTLEPM